MRITLQCTRQGRITVESKLVDCIGARQSEHIQTDQVLPITQSGLLKLFEQFGAVHGRRPQGIAELLVRQHGPDADIPVDRIGLTVKFFLGVDQMVFCPTDGEIKVLRSDGLHGLLSGSVQDGTAMPSVRASHWHPLGDVLSGVTVDCRRA